MKKILSLFLTVAIVLLLLLSATGCDQNEEEYNGEYYNYGLHYKLPEEYRKLTVSYSEFTYFNGEAYFFFKHMSGEKLIEESLPEDISVEAYAYNFASENNIFSPVMYDAATDTAFIEYVYDYSDSEVMLPPEFYYHYILRGSQLLYIVTMSCPAEKSEQYKPVFDGFMKDIKAD